MPQRLKDIRARGGKVILIDPRRNETAALVDQHLFIRPGTDAFLLLALLHVVFAEGLTRLGSLGSFTDGVETIRELVAEFPPERVAPITGIKQVRYEPWRENSRPPNPPSVMDESVSARKSSAASANG